MKTSKELERTWRDMERRGHPSAEIDKVYEEYWAAVDRERAEANRLNAIDRANLARQAEIARA